MKKMDARQLLEKYRNNTCTEEERALLEKWYLGFSEREFDRSQEYVDMVGQEIWENLPVNKKPRIVQLLLRIAAAAVILITFAFGSYFYFIRKNTKTEATYANDIAPGGNNAILTLANGKKISLSDAKSGELAMQSGIRITKTADGKLIYTIIDNQDNASKNTVSEINTIETPNGGDYQVNLPDGSKVWLNAASSLRFPTRFSNNERRVELKGEAYFEVSHNKALPFRVATSQQLVEVLGTHFNINSYEDEPMVKTTLLEGSVRVAQLASGKTALLRPGQQSVLQYGGLKVKDVDVAAVVAWKNEEFMFDNDDFRTEMRKIARWYDVEIVYAPSAPDNFDLGGFVSRTKNISAVLKLIELTGKVHFNIQGRRILVTK